MPTCSKGGSLKDGSPVARPSQKLIPILACLQSCWHSVGMYLCALAVAERSTGTPAHVTVTNCGVATPFVTVENTLWACPVPLLPRKMCQSRYVSHSSARLFSFLSKRCSFIFYHQQISSQWVGLCQEGLHVGSCPWETWYRGRPTVGTRIILESSAGGICLQTSLACVWCPTGRGSHPFPMLPLLRAGVWPSTASGWPQRCLHCTMTIPFSSACDFRM